MGWWGQAVDLSRLKLLSTINITYLDHRWRDSLISCDLLRYIAHIIISRLMLPRRDLGGAHGGSTHVHYKTYQSRRIKLTPRSDEDIPVPRHWAIHRALILRVAWQRTIVSCLVTVLHHGLSVKATSCFQAILECLLVGRKTGLIQVERARITRWKV